jgi:hypothetical protein
MWESFKATPKKTFTKTPVYHDYVRYDAAGEKAREMEGKRWQEREKERERQRERERAKDKERDRKRERRPKKAYTEFEDDDEDPYYPRTARRTSTTPTTPSFHEPYAASPTSAAPRYQRHKASTESMRSAPDLEEVTRRRQHSRTLSSEREPRRQASTEHARPRSSDPESERLRRLPSGESGARRHRDALHSPAPRMRRAETYTVDDTRYRGRNSPEVVYSPRPTDDFNYAPTKVKTAPVYSPEDVAYSASSGKNYTPYFGEVQQKSRQGYYVVD